MRTLLIAAALSACVFADSNPLTQAVTKSYTSAKQNLIETFEVMPEADYGYQLTKEQRPFSGWLEHTAMGNYSLCSSIKGEKPPEAAHAAHGLTKKADLTSALKQSFDYCDSALQGMDDKTALTERDGKYPVSSMVSLVTFLNEHYGNLVGYLRTKGITPPSSSRTKK
jgi:DinB superfamily